MIDTFITFTGETVLLLLCIAAWFLIAALILNAVFYISVLVVTPIYIATKTVILMIKGFWYKLRRILER